MLENNAPKYSMVFRRNAIWNRRKWVRFKMGARFRRPLVDSSRPLSTGGQGRAYAVP